MKAKESMKTQSFENRLKKKNIPRLTNVVIRELHLPNSVRSSPGTYSCAIDSFIDLFYHSLFGLLDRTYVNSPLLISLLDVCDKYKQLKTLHKDRIYKESELKDLVSNEVRNPIWSRIIDHCPSFRARDCHAEFSQIFQEPVFDFRNDLERIMFCSTYNFNQICINCGRHCIDSVSTFLQYFSWNETINDAVINEWPDLLFSSNLLVQEIVCQTCQTKIPARNLDIVPSTVLFIEFAENLMNLVKIHSSLSIRNISYSLRSLVRNHGTHFTIASFDSNRNKWFYIDDLSENIEVYNCFDEIQYHYQEGWFFCCYVQEDVIDSVDENIDLIIENVGVPVACESSFSFQDEVHDLYYVCFI